MAKRQKGVVGIVGLGIMGGAFAHNLHAAGWRVIGYDTDPKRRRALGRAGIAIAADVGALAAEAPSHHHKLAESVGAGGDRRRHRRGARAAPCRDRSLDL